MPFCASCGAQVEGRFCPQCGAAIVSGETSSPPPPPPPPTPRSTVPAATADSVSEPLAENVAGALCYVPALGWIIGIAFLLMQPYSRNRIIRFHAFQSILIAAVILAVDIIAGVMFRILMAILNVFGFLADLFWPLFGLACFLLWLYLLLMTYRGRKIVLPLIGPFAEQQAG